MNWNPKCTILKNSNHPGLREIHTTLREYESRKDLTPAEHAHYMELAVLESEGEKYFPLH